MTHEIRSSILGIIVGLLVIAARPPSEAGSITTQQRSVPYTAIVAADETATDILIDFNADGIADTARMVSIYNSVGNGVYCVTRGTAAASGAPLAVGDVLTIPPAGTPGSPLPTRLSCICAAGQTATVHIFAYP